MTGTSTPSMMLMNLTILTMMTKRNESVGAERIGTVIATGIAEIKDANVDMNERMMRNENRVGELNSRIQGICI